MMLYFQIIALVSKLLILEALKVEGLNLNFDKH
jgi:hypothetical protein